MAFAKLPASGRSHIMADINITPLTDIFLVLLIIFMVTSVAMVDTGAKVMLPEVDSTQSAPREITITVTPLHEIYVNADLKTRQSAPWPDFLREKILAYERTPPEVVAPPRA